MIELISLCSDLNWSRRPHRGIVPDQLCIHLNYSVYIAGQQQSDPPRIVDFMTRDLLAPGDVEFDKGNALKLPCSAVGNNLQWTWKHNDTVISTGVNFIIDANGTLHGSYLESAHSGHYQCFVKDSVSGVETFSRKIMVAVTG